MPNHEVMRTLKERRGNRGNDDMVFWKELDLLILLLEDNMEGIQNTEDALAQLKSDSEARDAATTTALTDLKAEVTALEAQGADTTKLNATISALDAAVKTGTAQSAAADPGAQPSKPAALTQPGYVFTPGEGIVVDARFTPSGFQVSPASTPPTQVLYFSGDTAGQPAVNANPAPGYAEYNGAVLPA